MSTKEVSFLLVEDDEVDLMMMRRAFRELKIANPLIHAENGLVALDHLRGTNGVQQLAAPYIIMLDLNMPLMGGLEFLDVVREDASLHRSIVFVLTTSGAERDRLSAYDKHVAGYIVKSNAASGFLDAVTMIDSYWRIVELP